MRNEEHERRSQDIPRPIRELGLHNTLIQHLITQYVMGTIITKEEFYCQAIAGLANNWSKQSEEYIKLLMTTTIVNP